jgi:hypothetical protein
MFCCKLTVATGPESPNRKPVFYSVPSSPKPRPLDILLPFSIRSPSPFPEPPTLSETTAWLASKNAIFSNSASSLSPPLEQAVFSPIHPRSSLGPCPESDVQRFESRPSTTPKTTGVSSFNTQSKDAFLGLLADRDRPLSRFQVSLLQPPCIPSLFVHLTLRIKSGGSRTGVWTNGQSTTLRVICPNLSN